MSNDMTSVQLHPKVAIPLLAGALVNVIIETAKARLGVDLTDIQPDLIIITMFVVGYFVPSR